MAGRGDQIQIRGRAGLGRLDVRQVLGAGDDPHVLVAADEVEDLFRVRQDDHRREPQLRVHAHDRSLVVRNLARALRVDGTTDQEQPERDAR